MLARGGNGRLCVRCNYGTGILPTLFGCELFLMEEDMNTLPTAIPLASRERVRSLVDQGVPDVHKALGAKVFEAAARFMGVFAEYPAIRQCIQLYHPDWQGPIDVAEVVWGSPIFYAFYDDPDLVRRFLSLVVDTYATFARDWYKLTGAPSAYTCHWDMLHKGTLMLRNDSLMNLSPEMYTEFVRPMDQRLFDEFGGGVVHFCGRGSHYIESLSKMRGLTGIAMSQPELNDMEVVFRNTVDKGIKLLDYRGDRRLVKNRARRGQTHCWQA